MGCSSIILPLASFWDSVTSWKPKWVVRSDGGDDGSCGSACWSRRRVHDRHLYGGCWIVFGGVKMDR